MHYCLVICQVSSTDQIYHRAAKRRGDKFDRSMTRGKLLGNNAQLFIFICILIMTQLISFLRFLLTAVRTGRLGLLPIKFYRGNNAVFVSVDLIGVKNKVILEFLISVSVFRQDPQQIGPRAELLRQQRPLLFDKHLLRTGYNNKPNTIR